MDLAALAVFDQDFLLNKINSLTRKRSPSLRWRSPPAWALLPTEAVWRERH